MPHTKLVLFLSASFYICDVIQGVQQTKDLEAQKHQDSGATKIIRKAGEEQFTMGQTKTVSEHSEVKQQSSMLILMFHPWGRKSHRGQQNALLLGLLNEGHAVTGVFPEKSNIIHDGYTEIVVETG